MLSIQRSNWVDVIKAVLQLKVIVFLLLSYDQRVKKGKSKKEKEEDRRSPISVMVPDSIIRFPAINRAPIRIRTRDSGNSLDRVPG